MHVKTKLHPDPDGKQTPKQRDDLGQRIWDLDLYSLTWDMGACSWRVYILDQRIWELQTSI